MTGHEISLRGLFDTYSSSRTTVGWLEEPAARYTTRGLCDDLPTAADLLRQKKGKVIHTVVVHIGGEHGDRLLSADEIAEVQKGD